MDDDFQLIERRRAVDAALRRAQTRTSEPKGAAPSLERRCAGCGKTDGITIERGCSLVCVCGYQEGCAD